jgi:DNA repair exonuclease SbcCD ATPase subunit
VKQFEYTVGALEAAIGSEKHMDFLMHHTLGMRFHHLQQHFGMLQHQLSKLEQHTHWTEATIAQKLKLMKEMNETLSRAMEQASAEEEADQKLQKQMHDVKEKAISGTEAVQEQLSDTNNASTKAADTGPADNITAEASLAATGNMPTKAGSADPVKIGKLPSKVDPK